MSKQGWYARNRHLYPPDWTDIANAVKTAAGWQCEGCGAPHGPSPHVLTVHHLSHDTSDNRFENLLSCCQRCHLRLGPHVYTKDEAIARLRRRAALDGAQQEMVL
jgi:5-methylcytosine-specific restriction endonuclease McrA